MLIAAQFLLMRLPAREPHFADTREFAEFARRHGLMVYVSPDDGGIVGPRLFAADHPADLKDLNCLVVSQCGLTPDWKGVVWVGVIHWRDASGDVTSILNPQALDGYWRVWGEVLVGGDPELLARLEQLYLQE
jgi:hypothetical protein